MKAKPTETTKDPVVFQLDEMRRFVENLKAECTTHMYYLGGLLRLSPTDNEEEIQIDRYELEALLKPAYDQAVEIDQSLHDLDRKLYTKAKEEGGE